MSTLSSSSTITTPSSLPLTARNTSAEHANIDDEHASALTTMEEEEEEEEDRHSSELRPGQSSSPMEGTVTPARDPTRPGGGAPSLPSLSTPLSPGKSTSLPPSSAQTAVGSSKEGRDGLLPSLLSSSSSSPRPQNHSDTNKGGRAGAAVVSPSSAMPGDAPLRDGGGGGGGGGAGGDHTPPEPEGTQKKGEGDHMSSVSVGVPEGASVVVLPGPFSLDGGSVLRDIPMAYSTYGTLAPDGRNAILVGHSLTSSTNVHEWWASMLGDGDEFCLDTSRFFVVCINYMSSCYGSVGPLTPDPDTGEPYSASFPMTSIRDNVRAQRAVLDHLGVQHVALAIGGSMGAMLVLDFAMEYPDFVDRLVCIAGCARHTDWGIALGKIERQAIMSDPLWEGGYYHRSNPPLQGLAVARMMAMLSYRNPTSLSVKFGRQRQSPGSGVKADVPGTDAAEPFSVESYLNYQGHKFVQRFDPLCYVNLKRTLDTHDCGDRRGGWHAALAKLDIPVLVIGISSDILYPADIQYEMANAMPQSVVHIIETPHGHDGFLIEINDVNDAIRAWGRSSLPDSREEHPELGVSIHSRSSRKGAAPQQSPNGMPGGAKFVARHSARVDEIASRAKQSSEGAIRSPFF